MQAAHAIQLYASIQQVSQNSGTPVPKRGKMGTRTVLYFSPRAAVLDPKFRADHESGLRIDQRSAADDENWILTFAVEC